MTREEYVAFTKDIALRAGKSAVLKYLAAQVPFFAGGFPAWIAGLIVGKVLEVAIKHTEFGAFFLYVDLRVDKQGNEFQEAALKWHKASPEEKKKYEKEYLESFYNFASLRS